MHLLAERANVSAGTLSKNFKKAYATTFGNYLLHRRIDKAKSLLAATPLTIFEVGSAVGIPDPQYFNKQFRKITGTSPSRYRDENQDFMNEFSGEIATKDGKWK